LTVTLNTKFTQYKIVVAWVNAKYRCTKTKYWFTGLVYCGLCHNVHVTMCERVREAKSMHYVFGYDCCNQSNLLNVYASRSCHQNAHNHSLTRRYESLLYLLLWFVSILLSRIIIIVHIILHDTIHIANIKDW